MVWYIRWYDEQFAHPLPWCWHQLKSHKVGQTFCGWDMVEDQTRKFCCIFWYFVCTIFSIFWSFHPWCVFVWMAVTMRRSAVCISLGKQDRLSSFVIISDYRLYISWVCDNVMAVCLRACIIYEVCGWLIPVVVWPEKLCGIYFCMIVYEYETYKYWYYEI